MCIIYDIIIATLKIRKKYQKDYANPLSTEGATWTLNLPAFSSLISRIDSISHSLPFPSQFSYPCCECCTLISKLITNSNMFPCLTWFVCFLKYKEEARLSYSVGSNMLSGSGLGSPVLLLLEPLSPFLTCSSHYNHHSAPGQNRFPP